MQQNISKKSNQISAGTLTQSYVTDASPEKGNENFPPSSTGKPLADGNASQSNPRLPVEILSINGKIKSFIGAIATFNCEYRVCVRIKGNKSFWASQKTRQIFEEKLLVAEILFKDIGSHEFFKPWSLQGVENFLASIPPEASEQKNQAETTENNMAKKTKTEKKTKAPKAGGKIAFADELLLAGKHTKSDIANQLSKKFEVPEKTARNTVSWAASTMKERIGKESKHLPAEKAEKPAKPAKAKKPAKKKAVKSKAEAAAE